MVQCTTLLLYRKVKLHSSPLQYKILQPDFDSILIYKVYLARAIDHGPLPWTVIFEKNYENLQFFETPFIKVLVSRSIRNTMHKKDLKLVVELAQLKFTYITVLK